jgi:hypothetical protein
MINREPRGYANKIFLPVIFLPEDAGQKDAGQENANPHHALVTPGTAQG